MDTKTLERLKAAGFVPTTVAEFLGLGPVDEALIEVKVRLAHFCKEVRKNSRLTQDDLAKILETSQQAVARAENGGSASLDFLMDALLTMGVTLAEIGEALCQIEKGLQSVAVVEDPAQPPVLTVLPGGRAKSPRLNWGKTGSYSSGRASVACPLEACG